MASKLCCIFFNLVADRQRSDGRVFKNDRNVQKMCIGDLKPPKIQATHEQGAVYLVHIVVFYFNTHPHHMCYYDLCRIGSIKLCILILADNGGF